MGKKGRVSGLPGACQDQLPFPLVKHGSSLARTRSTQGFFDWSPMPETRRAQIPPTAAHPGAARAFAILHIVTERRHGRQGPVVLVPCTLSIALCRAALPPSGRAP